MKPRKWWIAALLTIPLPGLGHLYCGKTKTTIIIFVMCLLVQVVPVYLFIFYKATVSILLIIPLFLILAIAHAIVVAVRSKASFEPKAYMTWYFYLVIWAVVVFGVFVPSAILFKKNVAEAFHMPSESMEPTVLKGDFMFADKWIYNNNRPERLDLIVFKYPKDGKTDYVKRVIGLPGETVEIDGNVIQINGEPLDTSFMSFENPRAFLNYGPKIVPDGHIFVLGDNFYNSSDSRYWGPLSLDKVTGKLVVIYYSIDYDSGIIRSERIGKRFR